MRRIFVWFGLSLFALLSATAISWYVSASAQTLTGDSPGLSVQANERDLPQATSTPCNPSFTDVHTTDYFYQDVRCVYCRGAISGYADGTFRPYNNTTRGQMAKIVVIALGITIATPTGTPSFTDDPPGSPFYAYVETALHYGIVSGYSDRTFRPNTNVTRGQLSKLVITAAHVVYGWAILNPSNAAFFDVPRGSTFYTYVETAVCRGVISGYSDATFRPNSAATRAQIAKIVCQTSRNPVNTCTGVSK